MTHGLRGMTAPTVQHPGNLDQAKVLVTIAAGYTRIAGTELRPVVEARAELPEVDFDADAWAGERTRDPWE